MSRGAPASGPRRRLHRGVRPHRHQYARLRRAACISHNRSNHAIHELLKFSVVHTPKLLPGNQSPWAVLKELLDGSFPRLTDVYLVFVQLRRFAENGMCRLKHIQVDENSARGCGSALRHLLGIILVPFVQLTFSQRIS
jgi:hypothetical protein